MFDSQQRLWTKILCLHIDKDIWSLTLEALSFHVYTYIQIFVIYMSIVGPGKILSRYSYVCPSG